MRLLILSLLSCSCFTYISSTKLPVQPRADNNDFLVQLILNISEAKVPQYIVDIIYDRPLEKGVTTEHVFSLYHVDRLTINDTLTILNSLNKTSESLFSLNGLNNTLEILNWSFTAFYNSLTANLRLSGTPLRNALVALQIDVNNFSSGITWGDPDPWEEFIKGVFTNETITAACTEAGITVEDLFGGIRDLVAADVASWPIQNVTQVALAHSIGQNEALIIWNALNITLEDVYNVELFRSIIGNFSERINNQTLLGILTLENNIYIHRLAHDLFESEVELIDINAQTVLTRRLVEVSNVNATIYQNIVVLRVGELPEGTEALTTIGTASVNRNLTNCEYLTVQNDGIRTVPVAEAVYFNRTFLIPRGVYNSVVLGSALVCNDTVYGLAREIVGDTIVLDVFEDYQAPELSGAISLKSYWLNGLILLVMCMLNHVLKI